jgi:hypothetical protein
MPSIPPTPKLKTGEVNDLPGECMQAQVCQNLDNAVRLIPDGATVDEGLASHREELGCCPERKISSLRQRFSAPGTVSEGFREILSGYRMLNVPENVTAVIQGRC